MFMTLKVAQFVNILLLVLVAGEFFHTIRTFSSLTGLGFIIASSLFSNRAFAEQTAEGENGKVEA